MADQLDDVLKLHALHNGVLGIEAEMAVRNRADLGKAYTPGVATISKMLAKDPALRERYTLSGKLVAVVSDGSAVLGLGDIGPAGALPVIEGKSLLYKDLAGVNALPISVAQVSTDEFVSTVKNIAGSFAGIHLEDIAAPRCFEIEERLSQELNIPVYHDDQEGTAIVVMAALLNAAKVVGKDFQSLHVLINGAGASGIAAGRLLFAAGVKHITLVDIDGVVTADDERYNSYQRQLAKQIGLETTAKTLQEAIVGQDVFVGLSDANVLTGADVKQMAVDPIILALANPVPEIDPAEAQAAGAAVIATGSSQYPNQVNNILVFPGLYKGLLASGLKHVTFVLEATIAKALAGLVSEPTNEHIVPGVFDDGVVQTVAKAVSDFAK
ncbi:NAD(P)-dependent malic enzyme [Furfurilactobacillus siliginis]|uniref:Malate dehydrogenase n=1 Tax=Furfurilactobacillus siliginis TaxID=348151 RepID=A0A510VUL7_9LACO|nr:malic enzyme-like NAD(P)-binding protein [Furfurilactobacillus siliginis]GEK28460.1 malate dehydrogenase [Furfurilactobacillus siliginis]